MMGVQITCEDNMELMARYSDNHFDLAVVDPPYGIGISANSVRQQHTKKDWDASTPSLEYFNELKRVSKNQIIWGGNYFPLPPSQYFSVWDKGEGLYGRSFAECEYAWVSNGGTRVLKVNPVQKDRIHPTQKPVKLYEWLLKNYSEPGQKILDTHLGSMSSAIACHDYKCHLTGFEIDEDYFEAGTKRVQNHVNQLQLF